MARDKIWFKWIWKAHMMGQMARMNDESLSASKIARAKRLAEYYYGKVVECEAV